MDFDKLHREESSRILSTLIRLLGDFDLAEEMMQEAYAATRGSIACAAIGVSKPAQPALE